MFVFLLVQSLSVCSYTWGNKRGTLSETSFDSSGRSGTNYASLYGSYVARDTSRHSFQFSSQTYSWSNGYAGSFVCSMASWSTSGNKYGAKTYSTQVYNGRTYPFEHRTTDYYYYIRLFIRDNGRIIPSSYTIPTKETKCINGREVKYNCMPAPTPTPRATPRPTPSMSPRPTPSMSPHPTPSMSPRPTPSMSPRPTPSMSPRPTPSMSPRPTPSASPAATTTPTPSRMFSKSQQFSVSSIFMKSNEFSGSIAFVASNEFTSSFEFVKSIQFSESANFSESYRFSRTNNFTESSEFTSSSQFEKSSQFSKSREFLNSDNFSISSDFRRSNGFTHSADFNSTDSFSKTIGFIKSNNFSISKYFTNSVQFDQSANFSTSNFFSSSSDFTKSADFNSTQVFKYSNAFSSSSPFAESSKFVRSKEYSPSNKMTKSENFINQETSINIKTKPDIESSKHVETIINSFNNTDTSALSPSITLIENPIKPRIISFNKDTEKQNDPTKTFKTITVSKNMATQSQIYTNIFTSNDQIGDNMIIKEKKSEIHKSNGLIIGLVIALLAVLIIITTIIILVKKRQTHSHQSENDMTTEDTGFETTTGSTETEDMSGFTNDNPLIVEDPYFGNIDYDDEDIVMNLFSEDVILE